MAAPLSTADRSRLEKIIGMLSSAFEPERLVALRKIQNIADEYRCQFMNHTRRWGRRWAEFKQL